MHDTFQHVVAISACLVFLWWLVLVAAKIPAHGMLVAQLLNVALVLTVAWQLLSELVDHGEGLNSGTTLLFALGAIWSLWFRREAMAFLDICFPRSDLPHRRVYDRGLRR